MQIPRFLGFHSWDSTSEIKLWVKILLLYFIYDWLLFSSQSLQQFQLPTGNPRIHISAPPVHPASTTCKTNSVNPQQSEDSFPLTPRHQLTINLPLDNHPIGYLQTPNSPPWQFHSSSTVRRTNINIVFIWILSHLLPYFRVIAPGSKQLQGQILSSLSINRLKIIWFSLDSFVHVCQTAS